MKLYTSLFALAFALSAQADQFKTVNVDKSSEKYEFKYDVPQFNDQSVPAYAKINDELVAYIEGNGCDAAEAAKSENGYNYDTSSTVVALNKNYVGVAMANDSYCGGAHPNTSTDYATFNSQTGEKLNIAKEFGFQDYDDPNYDSAKQELLHNKIAKILLTRIPADVEDCFAKMTPKEKLEQMETMYPYVAGLAKNGTLVLGVQPAHVIAVCGFFVRVNKKDVKNLLIKGSYLENWLK
jgi:hypothetical protein